MAKHPGFKSVQSSIAKKEGVSKESAGAILANASRHASASAKKSNPNLKKVMGKLHSGGKVPENGLYEMKKDETVIKAPATTGSQFNHKDKEPAMPKPTADNARQKFDGSDEPPADPKGGDCRCISPDGIVKRDGKKRFGF